MGSRSLSVLVPVVVAALALPQAQSTQQNQPVFRTGVQYVTVDVIVTGANDEPVSDLSVGDFEIREAGKKQTILDFDHISIPVNDRPIDLADATSPPSDIASNAPLSRAARAFVVVIDDGAINPEHLIPLKRLLEEFLQGLSADDKVAVAFVRRADFGQDFTDDAGALVRAVNRTTAAVGGGRNLRATRLVLENAVKVLSTAPQTRRAIVYVSNGFNMRFVPETRTGLTVRPGAVLAQARSQALDVMNMLSVARRAGVPIYTIDPSGLQDDIRGLKHEFLMTFAAATDGVGFVNQSDLRGAVRRLIRDNSSYYVLGYTPSPHVADGKFHEIDVKIVTRSGLRVRARPGYIAAGPPAASTAADKALLAALTEGQPHTGLRIRAFAAPVAATPRGARVLVALDLTYPKAAAADSPPVDTVEMMLLALDGEARVVGTGQKRFSVPAGADGLTISLDDTIDLPKGSLTLRIGANSKALDKIGTVHLPLEVPAPSSKMLRVSPLILGLHAEQSETAAGPGEFAEYLPFRPTTQRVFAETQQVRVFARVFGREAGRLTAQAVLKRGEIILRTVPVQITRLTAPDRIDCEATLPLDGLSAGAYVLEFNASVGAGVVTRRAVAFQIK